MGLFVLQETPVGYALFKAKSSKTLKKEGFNGDDESAESICSQLRLKDFHKFDSAATALEQTAALVEGKVTPRLSSLLDTIKDEAKASLAVADPKLASAINKLPQLDLKLVHDKSTDDMYRAIRNHLPDLIPGLNTSDVTTMSLGLSHSLSRHKLKFSTDKVDTMIVQAISLLDDLDKELNMYAMRVKEWYGWHFPEMAKIVNDNLAYARIILAMGMRSNAVNSDLAEILPEEIETAVKAAAEISMGTEITDDDLENIRLLADQVVSFTEYRAQLSNYLAARMAAIAPNLTALVGDLVGARLIAHSGSLMNLAKSPASTIQILGAEKALFRALKTKHDTPKYGLIYHASIVGQATGKNKGKIARVLAARAALGLRLDAMADWTKEGEGKGDMIEDEDRAAFGLDSRIRIERRLAALEGKPIRGKGVAIAPNGAAQQSGKWEVKEARKYNRDADGLTGDEPAAKRNKTNGAALIQDVSDAANVKKVKQDLINGEKSLDEVVSDAMHEDVEPMSEEEDDSEEDKPALTEVQTTRLPKSATGKSSKEDDSQNVEKLAAMAGLPVSRYLRKLERGEIKFDKAGNPISISKKDVKKARKNAEEEADGGKKRKREVVEVEEVVKVTKSNGESTETRKRKKDIIEDGPGEDDADKAERKRKKKEAKRAAKAALGS